MAMVKRKKSKVAVSRTKLNEMKWSGTERENLLIDPVVINQLLILSSGNFYSISEFVNSEPKVWYNFPIKLSFPRVPLLHL